MNRDERVIFLIFLTCMYPSDGSRNFKLLINNVKCIVKSNYILSLNCTVDKLSPGGPTLTSEVQMQKELTDIRVDFAAYLNRQNKESIPFFKVNNLNACNSVLWNSSIPLIKMYTALLLKHGNWPTKCPIPADYHFTFKGVALDPDFLPEFVPEADFKVIITLNEKRTKIWQTIINGRIIHTGKKNRLYNG